MKALIVANWKMHPATFKEAQVLLKESKRMLGLTKGIELIVAPPAVFLRDLAAKERKGRLSFAAQNAHFETAGSYTGEISMGQVRDAKATAVIIGHAERRAMGETNEEINRKVLAALSLQLTPILCVGERSREATADYFSVVRDQVRSALTGVAESKLSKVIIAYEPVWAIGAAAAMKPRDMHEMGIFIRKTIVEMTGTSGLSTRILYGGSMKAENAAEMLLGGDVKGLLVGRASADVQGITELLRAVHEA